MMTCTLVKSQNSETYELSGIRKYTYNEKGERSQKLSYDSENNLTKKVTYFYDNRGHKIRTEKRLAKGSLLAVYKYEFNEANQKVNSEKADILRHKKTRKLYYYNDLGQNIRTEHYAKTKLIKKVCYAYNTFGDQIEYAVCKANGEKESIFYIENKYNESDHVDEKIRRDEEGKLVKKNRYAYNKALLVETSFAYYYTGKRLNTKRVYEYDQQGRKIGSLKYTAKKLRH
jgi:hypothetical protein